MVIEYVFSQLTRLGYSNSQVEFSRDWLGRSPRYYSHLIASDREPGIATLLLLLHRLQRVRAVEMAELGRSPVQELVEDLERHLLLRACRSEGTARGVSSERKYNLCD